MAEVPGLAAHAANFVFLDRQFDLLQNGVDIGQVFVEDDLASQRVIRPQRAAFIQRPDFLAEPALLE